MAKKSPSIPSRVIDTLGIAPFIRKTREKVKRNLGKTALMGLVALGGGRLAQSEYRDITGWEPKEDKVLVAESSHVGESMLEAAKKLEEHQKELAARKTEGLWGKAKREASERIEKALDWGKKEVVPIEDIKKEYKEARKSVSEFKEDTLDAGDSAAWGIGFMLALIAQYKLAGLLANRRKKKKKEETEESITKLEAKKAVLLAENAGLKRVAELEAKAISLQRQLEAATVMNPYTRNEILQLAEKSEQTLATIELDS